MPSRLVRGGAQGFNFRSMGTEVTKLFSDKVKHRDHSLKVHSTAWTWPSEDQRRNGPRQPQEVVNVRSRNTPRHRLSEKRPITRTTLVTSGTFQNWDDNSIEDFSGWAFKNETSGVRDNCWLITAGSSCGVGVGGGGWNSGPVGGGAKSMLTFVKKTCLRRCC